MLIDETNMTDMERRRIAVARQLVEAGRSFHAFDFEGEQYPSKVTLETMKEAERAFADDDFDCAEHLARIVAYLVRRETPKFTANQKAWIEKRGLSI
jgi:hypothetical protein